MFSKLVAWLQRIFSDANGDPDDARISAFLLVLAYICNSATSVIMSTTHAFDAQQFGIGAGALAAGIGVWFGQRGGL